MTITTKKGDIGRSCWGGVGEGKDGLLLEVIGSIDEVSAVFQLIKVRFGGDEWDSLVTDLGKTMGVLVRGGKYDLREKIEVMEKGIRSGEKELVKINGFVNFKTERGAMINWARTVVRKAERGMAGLSRKRKLDKDMLVYFNRLSDYLFILARKAE